MRKVLKYWLIAIAVLVVIGALSYKSPTTKNSAHNSPPITASITQTPTSKTPTPVQSVATKPVTNTPATSSTSSALSSTSPVTTTVAAPPPTVTTPPPQPTTTTQTVTISSVTSPASPGSTATLLAQTTANSSCSIIVNYKSGPSRAAGLVSQTADANGNVSWTWNIGTNTTPGAWPITVTCSNSAGTATSSTDFTVS